MASALYRLDPQPDLYVFTENNSTDGTFNLIQRFDRPKKVIRLQFPNEAARSGCLRSDNHPETVHDIIGAIRQILLQVARQLDPDFAVFLDSDVRVMTHDLIPRLTRWGDKADIIGGPVPRPTFTRPAGTSLPPSIVRVFAALDFNWLMSSQRPLVEIGEQLVVGAGCMCLPRQVIQDRRLNFYPCLQDDLPPDSPLVKYDASLDPRLAHYPEDVAFCLHARNLGYRVALDWSIFLDHWVDDRAKPWTITHLDDPPETGVGTWLLGD